MIALLPNPIAVTTGSAGRFELPLPPGTVRIVAAGIGFAPETLLVSRDGARVQFWLTRAPIALTPVAVSAERSYSAASSETIRDLDLHLRPRESSQALLGLVPGLVIAQHAGGGKAEQIFLRGFDADHGTDVAVTVDGTPVNLVSHAHGQGYADLHFLIPEVVDRVEVRKGPYDVRDGDLATAGGVSFVTRDRIERLVVASRGGSFGTGHAIALVPVGGDASRPGGYLAAAGHLTQGPFERSQDYQRGNLFGKWTTPLGNRSQLAFTASGFGSRWDASGQIPERAVRAGVIGRFGAIDPFEGGHTSRFDASVAIRSVPGLGNQWEARAYATRYELDLFSNFTFFLNDTTNGDGIEQRDSRSILGASAFYSRAAQLGGRPSRWSVGAGTRNDFADVALDHQRQRTRLGPIVDAAVREASIYGWGSEEIDLSDRVRVQVALRGDLFRFEVRDRLSATGSGVRWRGIVSPKANLALRLAAATTAYFNIAGGFHSNDARDVIVAGSGERVLPRAVGTELGLRHAWHGGTIAVAAWRLDLESELVYVGDEGGTEASGATRRLGVDFEGRLRVTSWLWADADLNLSRGRFRGAPAGADRIPLAPSFTGVAGLTVRDQGPFTGGIRLRAVGTRAAIEDGSVRARGFAVWELIGRWQVSRFEIVGTVDNLFNAAWNEAQFATTSRLRTDAAPVTELHFTPGAPRAFQLGLEYRF